MTKSYKVFYNERFVLYDEEITIDLRELWRILKKNFKIILTNIDSNLTISGTELAESISNSGTNFLINALGSTGKDVITDYREGDTISIDSALSFTKITSGSSYLLLKMNDGGSVKLLNAADKKVMVQGNRNLNYINFTVSDSEVNYNSDLSNSIISSAYRFNGGTSSLQPVMTLFSKLQDYRVSVQNKAISSLKLINHYNFGTSNLNAKSFIEYNPDNEKSLQV